MSEHELWNELGNLYFVSGYYDQAIYAYHRSIQLFPEFGRPYGNLALVMAQKGHYEEAAQLYEKCLDLLDDQSEKVICLNKLGVIYRYLGNYEDALRAYQEADLLEVNNESLLAKNSLLPYVDGKLPRAIRELLDILKNSPIGINKPDAAINEDYTEPKILSSQHSLENECANNDSRELELHMPARKSISWFLHPEKSGLPDIREDFVHGPVAIEIDHDYSPAIVNSASPICLFVNAPSLRAPGIAVSRELLDLDVMDMPKPFIMQVSDELTEVVEESATMLIPQPLLSKKAPCVVHNSAIEDELNHFKRLVELDSGSAHAWATLGDLYKSVYAYQDAIFAFQKAVLLDPRKSSNFYCLGLVYTIEGEDDKAIIAFQRVIDLDPNNSLAHASLGGCFHRLGFEELAHQHINKARENIYMRENQYNQACFTAICGNIERSLELLEVALTKRQSTVEWASKDPDLESLRSLPEFQKIISQIPAS